MMKIKELIDNIKLTCPHCYSYVNDVDINELYFDYYNYITCSKCGREFIYEIKYSNQYVIIEKE